MIDEATEELASLYVCGLLTPEERTDFEDRLSGNEELAALVARLESATAALARAVPPRDPPPGIRARLLAEIRPVAMNETPATGSGPRWALAASIALLAGGAVLGWLYWQAGANLKAYQAQAWTTQTELVTSQSQTAKLQDQLQSSQKEADNLRAQLESMRGQLASLQARDVLSQIKIATLTSLIQNTPKASAVVAWDPTQQRGLVKASGMPSIGADQDYQLWIIDPNYKQPVNGGVFHAEGAEFKPDQPVHDATKFAVSVERKGGVPVRQGPIVLLGE